MTTLYRTLRGGSCWLGDAYCRSAFREKAPPGYRSWDWGFRPVAEVEVTPESDRVFRGGSFWYGARLCRSASRLRFDPGIWVRDWGFRPVADSRGPAVQKPE